MSELGQDTGKSDLENGHEARKLLKLIAPAGKEVVSKLCGAHSARFVAEQVARSNGFVTHYCVTGKQLFWLRDIKDKLVERGAL
jgi:hypothetical protein